MRVNIPEGGAAKDPDAGKSPHQRRVEEMMNGFGQAVLESPQIPSRAVRLLRARLILEEALETIEALGVAVYGCDEENPPMTLIEFDCLDFRVDRGKIPNLEKIADGCADISVVTIGTLSACGIRDEPLLEEVDANNLLKLRNATKDQFGKFCKAKDHPDPDIMGVLGRYR